jgi:microcystin-dependent protein
MPNSTTNYAFNLPLVNDSIDADLWGTQLNANWSSLDTLLKTANDNIALAQTKADDGVWVGKVDFTATAAAPTRWLLARGQAVSRTTYSALFAAIGTTYGVGDGSTTFNIPDIGGRVIAGSEATATRLTSAVSGVDGATLGAAGGNQNMQQHNHGVTDPGHNHTAPYQVGFAASGGGNPFSGVSTIATSTATTGITIQNTGTGTSQNVQPTIVLNAIIYAGA